MQLLDLDNAIPSHDGLHYDGSLHEDIPQKELCLCHPNDFGNNDFSVHI